jgi:hypothetical protein
VTDTERPAYDDYESTGQWMVACVIADYKDEWEIEAPIPTEQEISDAIDGANAGHALGEYIGAAWEAAAEIVYDMFPQFHEPEEDEE